MNEQTTMLRKEIPTVSYRNENGEQMFLLARHPESGAYVLYKDEKNKLIRLGKGNNPNELERKHRVLEQLAGA